MIKVIVFDCGGVILSNAWEDPQFDKIPKLLDISKEKADEIFWKHYDIVKFGKGNENDLYKELIKNSKSKISVRELRKIYHGLIVKKPAFRTMKKLSKRYPLYAMNNEGKEWMDLRIRKFQLRKYFKDFICSAYVGYIKPDERIYKIMLKKVKVDPGEIVFIDNQKENIREARKLGINTILFRNVNQLKKELLKFGIHVD